MMTLRGKAVEYREFRSKKEQEITSMFNDARE